MATKKKTNENCCGKRETEVNTKVTEYGTFACDIPAGSRMYVGARYVWKFADPLQWNKTTSYELYTVVQNNGYTYVSKKPVPANVEITNTDFWYLVADPNAQMEEIRQYVTRIVTELEETVETYDERINTAASLAKNNVVVIADSYGNSVNYSTNVTSFLTLLEREFSNRQNQDIMTSFKSGAGFGSSTNNFITPLQTVINNATEDFKNGVKKIVVASCINDRQQSLEAMRQGINNFKAEARAAFPNLENIIACPCGMAIADNTLASAFNYEQVIDLHYNYARLERDGYIETVPNGHLVMRKDEYFLGDGLHPTDLGNKIVFDYVLSAIDGVPWNACYDEDVNITLTAPNGASISQLLNIGVRPTPGLAKLRAGNPDAKLICNFNEPQEIVLNGTNEYKVAEIPANASLQHTSYMDFKCPVNWTVRKQSDNSFIGVQGELHFKENAIYMRGMLLNDAGTAFVTVPDAIRLTAYILEMPSFDMLTLR